MNKKLGPGLHSMATIYPAHNRLTNLWKLGDLAEVLSDSSSTLHRMQVGKLMYVFIYCPAPLPLSLGPSSAHSTQQNSLAPSSAARTSSSALLVSLMQIEVETARSPWPSLYVTTLLSSLYSSKCACAVERKLGVNSFHWSSLRFFPHVCSSLCFGTLKTFVVF